MNWSKEEDQTTYRVVVNKENQYSIWSDLKEIPDGWQTVGKAGNKEACLTYIKEVWTDMRPLSLRSQMSAAGKSETAARAAGQR
ncbi:MbtH family protein [Methylobacter sp. YRD-M1]|uniref:MbtH family protein n=1 Tax=Methylobacter sp. YRD-M1 TaxID=2911520 RepID=UPI00227B4EEC|nr:MbtH family NRPS accessory protein [Methylobacter sp. YRD-M1]WAK00944.1 MbtH family NRPS accessory protein [Methylobacter sp. YRD-M1]